MIAMILTGDKLFGAFCICVSIFLIVGWIKDLLFYKSVGWDFSKNSGRNYIGYGSTFGIPVSNLDRVCFSFPFLIILSLLFGVVFLLR